HLRGTTQLSNRRLKKFGQAVGEQAGLVLLPAADDETGQAMVRRIVVSPAMRQLAGRERFVIMDSGEGYAGVFGAVGLHQHLAAARPAPRPPRHLGEEL